MFYLIEALRQRIMLYTLTQSVDGGKQSLIDSYLSMSYRWYFFNSYTMSKLHDIEWKTK